MHLSTARLCLDCEEVHDAQVCPVCASETFSFLTRWITAPEPRKKRSPPPTPEVEVYRQLIGEESTSAARRVRMLRQGMIGLTAVGALGWLWRSSHASAPKDQDEGPAPSG